MSSASSANCWRKSTTRAAKILKLRYGLEGEDPMTLKEIGDRIGLTRERVRQIEHEALAGLRNTMLIEK